MDEVCAGICLSQIQKDIIYRPNSSTQHQKKELVRCLNGNYSKFQILSSNSELFYAYNNLTSSLLSPLSNSQDMFGILTQASAFMWNWHTWK